MSLYTKYLCSFRRLRSQLNLGCFLFRKAHDHPDFFPLGHLSCCQCEHWIGILSQQFEQNAPSPLVSCSFPDIWLHLRPELCWPSPRPVQSRMVCLIFLALCTTLCFFWFSKLFSFHNLIWTVEIVKAVCRTESKWSFIDSSHCAYGWKRSNVFTFSISLDVWRIPSPL